MDKKWLILLTICSAILLSNLAFATNITISNITYNLTYVQNATKYNITGYIEIGHCPSISVYTDKNNYFVGDKVKIYIKNEDDERVILVSDFCGNFYRIERERKIYLQGCLCIPPCERKIKVLEPKEIIEFSWNATETGDYKVKVFTYPDFVKSLASSGGESLNYDISEDELCSYSHEFKVNKKFIIVPYKPTFDLFVMSYCPFGLQAEKALLPVYNLLKDKAEIKIHFVNYVMHGKKELDENLRQYCIQLEQEDKLYDYLNCFVIDGNYTKCIEEAKIDKTKLNSCMERVDKEFNITEMYNDRSTWLSGRFPRFNVEADLNEKYGVRGSPTFVLNGKIIYPTRSPEAIKELICSAFIITKPKECEQTLSTKITSPGLVVDIDKIIENITLDLTKEESIKNLKIHNYLKNHPDVTKAMVKSIVVTINSSPELLTDFDELAEETLENYKNSKTYMTLSLSESPEAIGLSWFDVISWIFKLIKRADVDILADNYYLDNNIINTYFIATSAGILSTKIISDYEDIGKIGKGYFTFPQSKIFTSSVSGLGEHYIIIYPTIADKLSGKTKELVIMLLGDGFLINISKEKILGTKFDVSQINLTFYNLSKFIGNITSTANKTLAVCNKLDLSDKVNTLEIVSDKVNTLKERIKNIANYYKYKNKEKEVCWNEVLVSFDAVNYKITNIISEMKEDNGKI